MGLLVQGEQVRLRERFRRGVQRLMHPPMPQAPMIERARPARPGWLLLCIDTCCLIGCLILTLYISWGLDRLPIGDPREYYAYAQAFWFGSPRFAAFPREYPPLTLLPFSATLIPSVAPYYWAFAAWMGLVVCLSYLWLARTFSRGRAMTYALYLLVGATGTLLMRFDLLPGLATLGALMLAERKRYRWAYTLLAIGVLLKLYPVFLVPVLLTYQWRTSAHRGIALRDARALRQQASPLLAGLGIFGGITLLGFGIPALITVSGTLSEFNYNLVRPIQVESLPATLLWLGTFVGFPVTPNNLFVSLNLVGPLDKVLKQLSLLGLVAGTLLVCWRVWRGKLLLGPAFVATIALVMVSNKLLSPQYLLWILPLVAYVEGFDLLWLVICALTTLIFPFMYQTRHPILTVPTNPAFFPTIAARNALLVIATIQAVRGRRGERAVAPDKARRGMDLSLAELGRSIPVIELSPVPLETDEFSSEVVALTVDEAPSEETGRLVESTR